MNSLPKTVTRQRRDCDLNPGSSAPESSTLTTRLPNHQTKDSAKAIRQNKKPKLSNGKKLHQTTHGWQYTDFAALLAAVTLHG